MVASVVVTLAAGDEGGRSPVGAKTKQRAPVVVGLVGRGEELRRIGSLFVESGGGSLVLRGDPGVGKTSLLDAAVGLAEEAGRRVLRAAGVDTALTELGVPDEFIDHASRAQIFEQVGLTPHLSPDNSASPLRSLAREAAAVAVGRVIGYRRLSSVL